MKIRPVVPLLALIPLLAACPDLGGPQPMAQPASYDTGAGGGKDSATATDTGGAGDAAHSDINGKDSNLGGIDTGGSCKGICNKPFDKSAPCQCNSDCGKFGNCCADYGAECIGGPLTCEGRCGADYQAGKPCQCSWDCAKFGTCCPDLVKLCHKGEDLDFFPLPKGKCTKDADWKKVKHVSDGDTIILEETDSKGENVVVRFLLVDTPELSTDDCYAIQAKKFTYAQIQKSPSVCLVQESKSDNKDVYGRLLRYVFYKEPVLDGAAVELNMRLLRLGYARVLYPFAKGNPFEAHALLTMAKAKEDGLGGWGSCGWLKPK